MTTATQTAELTGTYEIDASHSQFGFGARHAMVTKVRGGFKTFSGTLEVDGATPTNSTAVITIDATSIDTGNPDRDGHLKSNDFFDMENYPELRFASTSIEQTGDTTFAITGDLTIKDVTKAVTFDSEYMGAAVDPWGNTRIGLEGSTQINRKDWGVNWNTALEAGGVLVSEKVTIEFEIAAVKQS